MFEKQYYEQPDIRGVKELSKKGRERARITYAMIPEEVQSILDVGCGDGIITNILAKQYDVTGIDFSKEVGNLIIVQLFYD